MSKAVFTDIFAFSGRRNRKSYFLYLLALLAISGVLWTIALASQVGAIILLATLAQIAIAVSAWLVGAQRCRDFGWTGWATLLSLIPVVGWIFPFAMLFIPGTAGPNRYGSDPLETQQGVAAPANWAR